MLGEGRIVGHEGECFENKGESMEMEKKDEKDGWRRRMKTFGE